MLQASVGQESSWPPPPQEAEEERTIAPGFSFDLPDPPTEMDQMDSEIDKLDISDEEMRATGLPSDEDDKTDTETGRYKKRNQMECEIVKPVVLKNKIKMFVKIFIVFNLYYSTQSSVVEVAYT